MAQGGAYENPQQLFSTDNVTVMMQTMARYRQDMAMNQEKLIEAIRSRKKRVKANREFTEKAMTPYGEAMSEAKTALQAFDQKLKGDKESLNMKNQIDNALDQEAKRLKEQISKPNLSMPEIQALTSESIAIANNLKTDFTNLMAAYEEWKSAQGIPPGEDGHIPAGSNPQLQLLFQKMDSREDDIILQQDPTTKEWVFIPLENESDISKKKKEYAEKGTKDELIKQKEKLTADLAALDTNDSNYNEKSKAINDRIATVEGKINRVTSYDNKKPEDYDEQKKKISDETEANKGYAFDKDIGIVILGDIAKIYNKNNTGNFFKHTEVGTESNLYKQHDQLKKDGAFQMYQRSGEGFTKANLAMADKGDGEDDLGNKLMADKSQIVDYYMNKAGKSMINAYINEDNLEGQLEGLLGGDADVYYDNNMVGNQYVDFGNMTPAMMKSEISRIMVQNIVDREGVSYRNQNQPGGLLGTTLEEDSGNDPANPAPINSPSPQITFKK